MHFTPAQITNIVLHIILIACFISVFFFIYAVNIEEKVVETQVDYIVADFVDNLAILDDSSRNILKQYVNTIKKPNLDNADKQVTNKNNGIRNYVFKIACVAIIFGALFVYFMTKTYNFSAKELMFKNVVFLVFVALTEYCFLTYLGSQFRSGDPNYAKRTMASTLQKISNEK